MNGVDPGQRCSALTPRHLPHYLLRLYEESVVPKIQSAKKAMRQARTRQARNKVQRSALRTALKRVRQAPTADAAAKALASASRLLDRAARKGLVHANHAARHKSRLAKFVRRKTA
jgi:small subunit ribosomal protein S20